MAASEMIAMMKVLPGWMTVFSITEEQKQCGVAPSAEALYEALLKYSLNSRLQFCFVTKC